MKSKRFGEKTNNWSKVYFVQGENGGPIKIGHTDKLQTRIKTMQTGNPDKLVVLHVTYGGAILEKELHKKFEHLHYRGEWFKSDPEILVYIRELENNYNNAEKRLVSIVEFALAIGEYLTSEERKLLQELVNGVRFAPGVTGVKKYENILKYYKDYLINPDKYNEYLIEYSEK